MDKIASELLIERLVDWDVDTIFGLPGDGINGIMEGIRRHKDKIRFFLVHHEEAAAFMATGYAKTTGRLGVCLATPSPACNRPPSWGPSTSRRSTSIGRSWTSACTTRWWWSRSASPPWWTWR